MVSTDAVFTTTDAGAKDLTTVGGLSTVRVAFAALPVLALLLVTGPVELRKLPAEAVTLTVTVQEPLAGMVPPESETDVPLLAAVTAPPLQVVAPAGDEVLTRFAG